MAVATVPLTPGAATFPDGSSGNAAPALSRQQGTEANPKKHFLTLDFDATTDEHAWWTFRLPGDVASTPGFVVKLLWFANATANAVRWACRVGAVTADDTDTPLEHVTDTATGATTNVNTTEANRLTETSITIADADRDAAAAGDLFFVLIYRDPDHAGDTCTVDAKLVAASIEYTLA